MGYDIILDIIRLSLLSEPNQKQKKKLNKAEPIFLKYLNWC